MGSTAKRFHIKILAFVFLWHELVNCFAIGANEAFAAALGFFFAKSFIEATGFELAGMSGRLTAVFVTRGSLWLALFFWLAPRFARDLPISIICAGFFGLAFVGAWARGWFFEWIQNVDGEWFRERSEAIVSIAMGAVAMCFLSTVCWGSVLPLLGYVLLPILPMSCGWLARTPEEQWRFDASFGTYGMFHDVGSSSEV